MPCTIEAIYKVPTEGWLQAAKFEGFWKKNGRRFLFGFFVGHVSYVFFLVVFYGFFQSFLCFFWWFSSFFQGFPLVFWRGSPWFISLFLSTFLFFFAVFLDFPVFFLDGVLLGIFFFQRVFLDVPSWVVLSFAQPPVPFENDQLTKIFLERVLVPASNGSFRGFGCDFPLFFLGGLHREGLVTEK